MTEQQPQQSSFLEPFSHRAFAVACVVCGALLLGLFHLFPGIDIAVSRLFFTAMACPAGFAADAACGRFGLEQATVASAVRNVLHVAPVVIAIAIAGLALFRVVRLRRWRDPFNLAIVGLVTALALGPGVVVNLFLKEVSGRPRPRDTVLFGGDLPFVPAGTFSDHCLSNCSFVSGEAAASFWLVGLACLLPPALRPGGALVLCAVAAVGASMRVMFGAHYLSDALLGGIVSLLVISIVAIALRGTAKAWEIGNAGDR